MKVNKFVAIAERLFGNAFPDYLVKLVRDPDDTATFFVYTFNVPDGIEREVENRMYDLIESELDGNGWDIIPSVKSLSTTRMYYPQHFREPSPLRVVPNEMVLKSRLPSR